MPGRAVQPGFPRKFPVHRNIFPVPDYREFDTMTAETLGNFGLDPHKRVQNQKNSLYFPCITGISPQRRVRPRLPPPPLSLPEQRLSGQAMARSEKVCDSAGFWEARNSEADRRQRVRGQNETAVGVFLCRQVERFPFALDSPVPPSIESQRPSLFRPIQR